MRNGEVIERPVDHRADRRTRGSVRFSRRTERPFFLYSRFAPHVPLPASAPFVATAPAHHVRIERSTQYGAFRRPDQPASTAHAGALTSDTARAAVRGARRLGRPARQRQADFGGRGSHAAIFCWPHGESVRSDIVRRWTFSSPRRRWLAPAAGGCARSTATCAPRARTVRAAPGAFNTGRRSARRPQGPYKAT